jgi:hypothetical protein
VGPSLRAELQGLNELLACKENEGTSYGRFAVRDGLTPLLEKAAAADALVLVSPVYYGTAAGALRSSWSACSFLIPPIPTRRRRFFPAGSGRLHLTTSKPRGGAKAAGFDRHFDAIAGCSERILGPAECLCSFETCLFEDYSRYVSPLDPSRRRGNGRRGCHAMASRPSRWGPGSWGRSPKPRESTVGRGGDSPSARPRTYFGGSCP